MNFIQYLLVAMLPFSGQAPKPHPHHRFAEPHVRLESDSTIASEHVRLWETDGQELHFRTGRQITAEYLPGTWITDHKWLSKSIPSSIVISVTGRAVGAQLTDTFSKASLSVEVFNSRYQVWTKLGQIGFETEASSKSVALVANVRDYLDSSNQIFVKFTIVGSGRSSAGTVAVDRIGVSPSWSKTTANGTGA